jgi:flagellar basal-body rod protein FlgB
MDMSNLSLFRMARQKMGWAGQRQVVLSQNIANADTPSYRARDLAPLDFNSRVKSSSQVNLSKTAGNHLQGTSVKPTYRVEDESRRDLYEITPDGNQVVLEEQMMKVADNQAQFQLASNIYRKNMQMFRMAVSGNSQ